tara:strand:- start:252 stop:572 length:321 start_codon:yes stop_codon:yes gene_type:complete
VVVADLGATGKTMGETEVDSRVDQDHRVVEALPNPPIRGHHITLLQVVEAHRMPEAQKVIITVTWRMEVLVMEVEQVPSIMPEVVVDGMGEGLELDSQRLAAVRPT